MTAEAMADKLAKAADGMGKWLSAAMDDPEVCAEMKADIMKLLEALAAYRQERPANE